MLFYKDISIKALRLEELKELLIDKEIEADLFKEALLIGQQNYRKDFESYLLKLATLNELLSEGNKKLLDDFILNQTKLILPTRTRTYRL